MIFSCGKLGQHFAMRVSSTMGPRPVRQPVFAGAAPRSAAVQAGYGRGPGWGSAAQTAPAIGVRLISGTSTRGLALRVEGCGSDGAFNTPVPAAAEKRRTTKRGQNFVQS